MDIKELAKSAMKKKVSVLPDIRFDWNKSDGWIVFINNNRTCSCLTYATAELCALIQGAAPWQLEQIETTENRMNFAYPHLKGIQLLDRQDYILYLEQHLK